MKKHQAFTEKFYGAHVEGPSKCQNIHDSFIVWFENFRSCNFNNNFRGAASAIGEKVILRSIECLLLTVSYHIFMNNYFTTFRLFNIIWATRVLNKNRLCKCIFLGDKNPEKKECCHFEQRTVVGLNDNRVVGIAFSKISEPKRFARRLNKVQGKYIQE